MLVATQRGILETGSGQPIPRRIGEPQWHQSAAAWSPDGRQLVYAKEGELHLASRDGTEIRTLVTVKGRPFFVRWSPDGKKIRFSLGQSFGSDGSSSLWEVSVETGRLNPILPDWKPEWYNCCGNWTPDGKYYVFQSNGNIWIRREKANLFGRAEGDPIQLTTGPLNAYWPLPSPDGKRLFIAGCQARAEFLRYDIKTRQFLPDLVGISGTEMEYARGWRDDRIHLGSRWRPPVEQA